MRTVERKISCVCDSLLLERVSKIRQHMGLTALSTTLTENEIDPVLLLTLDEVDGLQSLQGLECILDASFERWDQWNKWHTWDMILRAL